MSNYQLDAPSAKEVDIYTIGHSTLIRDEFLDVLQACGVTAVVDVRSDPHSMMADQFNIEGLQPFLRGHGCQYVHIGDSLGARQTDPSVLNEQGQVDFSKVMHLETFQKGLDRLQDGMSKGFKIAIMCSERDPLTCHRFGLVARALKARDVKVWHIIPETVMQHAPNAKKPLSKIKSCKVVSQNELEAELMVKYDKKIDMLFLGDGDPLEQAYQQLNNDIGFSANDV